MSKRTPDTLKPLLLAAHTAVEKLEEVADGYRNLESIEVYREEARTLKDRVEGLRDLKERLERIQENNETLGYIVNDLESSLEGLDEWIAGLDL